MTDEQLTETRTCVTGTYYTSDPRRVGDKYVYSAYQEFNKCRESGIGISVRRCVRHVEAECLAPPQMYQAETHEW